MVTPVKLTLADYAKLIEDSRYHGNFGQRLADLKYMNFPVQIDDELMDDAYKVRYLYQDRYMQQPKIDLTALDDSLARYVSAKTTVPEPMASPKAERRHTAGYNPKGIDGRPLNGADIDLPSFPEHHVGAVIARANVARTPENQRIAAYAVGMSLDLLMQFLAEQDPNDDLDEVKDFRYMLEQFTEWAGFQNFDVWRKDR